MKDKILNIIKERAEYIEAYIKTLEKNKEEDGLKSQREKNLTQCYASLNELKDLYCVISNIK